MHRGLAASGLALLGVLLGGCPRYGIIDDGTSVSFAGTAGGALRQGVELPVAGEGYRIPKRWADRGLRYGTDELVSVIVRAGRRLSRESPDAELAVGDLSPRIGGDSAWHRSHQSGRDADLIFFAVDEAGRPVRPETMDRYQADGAVVPRNGPDGKPLPPKFFDVERNWLLVRALVEDERADLQYLFIYAPLRRKLLDHAVAIGEPPGTIARAAALLHQPSDSLPHDDHLHVRIYCPAADRLVGCRDRGTLRWKKKGYKYETQALTRPAGRAPAVVVALPGPGGPSLLSLHGLGVMFVLPVL